MTDDLKLFPGLGAKKATHYYLMVVDETYLPIRMSRNANEVEWTLEAYSWLGRKWFKRESNFECTTFFCGLRVNYDLATVLETMYTIENAVEVYKRISPNDSPIVMQTPKDIIRILRFLRNRR
jgi:hypothetical protein